MPRLSAGLLMYRTVDDELEFLLVHPGGPYFAKKDEGVWSIPKGEPDTNEDLLVTAQREFQEETSVDPTGPFIPLKPIKQKGGKIVHAWAFEGDCDPSAIKSNNFKMEWPPKSGQQTEFPEVDRAEFFDVEVAKQKINPAQIGLLDELIQTLSNGFDSR